MKTIEAISAEIVGPAFANASISFAKASAIFDKSAARTSGPFALGLRSKYNMANPKIAKDKIPRTSDVQPTTQSSINPRSQAPE
jgi:hypothetical protein